jgi:TonB family protein
MRKTNNQWFHGPLSGAATRGSDVFDPDKIGAARLSCEAATGPDPFGFTVQRGAAVERVGGGVSEPVVIYEVDPDGPRGHGTVLLRVVVDVDGKAKDIRLVDGLGPGFDQSAMECVRKWRFTPGRKNGQPVPVEFQVEVKFRIK